MTEQRVFRVLSRGPIVWSATAPQTRRWPLKWLQWQQKLAFWFTTCRHRARDGTDGREVTVVEGGEWEGRGGKKKNKTPTTASDKSVKARVKAAVEKRIEEKGTKNREAGKKKPQQQHADWTVTIKLKGCWESVSFKSSGQANKAAGTDAFYNGLTIGS